MEKMAFGKIPTRNIHIVATENGAIKTLSFCLSVFLSLYFCQSLSLFLFRPGKNDWQKCAGQSIYKNFLHCLFQQKIFYLSFALSKFCKYFSHHMSLNVCYRNNKKLKCQNFVNQLTLTCVTLNI